MKSMTSKLRKEIQLRIKNRQDISDLIKDIDIRNEHLNRAIIKNFDAIHRDISGCSFVGAVIGEEKKSTYFNWCIGHNCCFKDTTFLGTIIFRNADFRGSIFTGAFVPFIEYQHADMRGCNMCDAIWRFGSRAGHGSKWDSTLILKKWGLKLE